MTSSVEETALAVDALASSPDPDQAIVSAVRRGAGWLITHTQQGGSTPASPIGLYFAQLWYFEQLYPLVFSLAGLGNARRLCQGR